MKFGIPLRLADLMSLIIILSHLIGICFWLVCCYYCLFVVVYWVLFVVFIVCFWFGLVCLFLCLFVSRKSLPR